MHPWSVYRDIWRSELKWSVAVALSHVQNERFTSNHGTRLRQFARRQRAHLETPVSSYATSFPTQPARKKSAVLLAAPVSSSPTAARALIFVTVHQPVRQVNQSAFLIVSALICSSGQRRKIASSVRLVPDRIRSHRYTRTRDCYLVHARKETTKGSFFIAEACSHLSVICSHRRRHLQTLILTVERSLFCIQDKYPSDFSDCSLDSSITAFLLRVVECFALFSSWSKSRVIWQVCGHRLFENRTSDYPCYSRNAWEVLQFGTSCININSLR